MIVVRVDRLDAVVRRRQKWHLDLGLAALSWQRCQRKDRGQDDADQRDLLL